MKRTFPRPSPTIATALILAALAVALLHSEVSAQIHVFTYQGSLDDAGNQANGLHDFRFRLFDVASGGTPIGSQLCLDNVNVVDGVFTAQLDFGQQFVTSGHRYLEIEVRRDTGLTCGNSSGFVVMAPRQRVTAAPLASHAFSAFRLDAADGSPVSAVYVDEAGRVGINTTAPQNALHVNGSLQWGGIGQTFAYSGIDGSGLFFENRTNMGAASKIRLQTSKSGDLSNYAQLFIDPYSGFSFMSLGTGNNNVGIGTTTPTAKLDVRGSIRLGSNGELLAASGVENLRMLRGTIDGNGSTTVGTGFTSQRLSEGLLPHCVHDAVLGSAECDLHRRSAVGRNHALGDVGRGMADHGQHARFDSHGLHEQHGLGLVVLRDGTKVGGTRWTAHDLLH